MVRQPGAQLLPQSSKLGVLRDKAIEKQPLEASDRPLLRRPYQEPGEVMQRICEGLRLVDVLRPAGGPDLNEPTFKQPKTSVGLLARQSRVHRPVNRRPRPILPGRTPSRARPRLRSPSTAHVP